MRDEEYEATIKMLKERIDGMMEAAERRLETDIYYEKRSQRRFKWTVIIMIATIVIMLLNLAGVKPSLFKKGSDSDTQSNESEYEVPKFPLIPPTIDDKVCGIRVGILDL